MLELAFPWALLLLPLPWIIWFYFPSQPQLKLSGLPVPFFQSFERAFKQTQGVFCLSKLFYFFALIWGLLCLALAGPQWLGKALPSTYAGRNIFLVLDVSGSMAVPDMHLDRKSATRLQVVKQAAVRFVQSRTTDHIGLILFGSEAYLQTPLTFDRPTILKRIIDASVGLAGKTTSIGDALGLAVKKLKSTPLKGRVIILLTDGANNSGMLSPEIATKLSHAENIKVYTIGLAPELSHSKILDAFINLQGNADLDEPALKKIAKDTGGKYFRATDSNSLNQIYQTIDALETTEQLTPPVQPKTEFFPWIISLCLLLLVGYFFRWLGR